MKKPTTGSFELIKSLNTDCILSMIRVAGPISRADVARGTGLTPATVSNITAELMEVGLIEETERGESSGGRKPVLLSIARNACYFGALYIGSTRVEAAVTDVEAGLCGRRVSPLPKGSSPEDAVRLCLSLLRAVQKETGADALAGIGVCTHGLVRTEEGLLAFAPNLGWRGVHLGAILNEATGLRVVVENDVRAMALAESWRGCARGVKDYVYLFVGPGIGGSIVSGSELYRGEGEFAGEFGHVTLEPDGPLCTCGNRGCLQALASETATLRRFEARVPARAGLDFPALLQAAKGGDGDARDALAESVRYIGIEVGNIINTLSPSLLIVNGSITEFDAMQRLLNEEIRRHCLRVPEADSKIAFSELGANAPIFGAATCIIRQMFRSPQAFLSARRGA